MQLGISSYTFTWAMGIRAYEYVPRMDLFGLIRKTKELGLDLLQIADNAPLHVLPRSELEELAAFAGSAGVHIEIGSKGMTKARIEEYMELSRIFSASLLRFIIDHPGESWFPSPDIVIDLCRNVEPLLEKHGITMVIENHDRLRTDEFERIIRETGSPRIGICLDCANSLGAGEGIFETVDRLSPYTLNLHLKDIQITRKEHMMGFDVQGVPFGEGIIPLHWVLSRMPEMCRSAILELWVPPEESIGDTIEKENEWASRSLEYIRKIIK